MKINLKFVNTIRFGVQSKINHNQYSQLLACGIVRVQSNINERREIKDMEILLCMKLYIKRNCKSIFC